jgi:UDP-N-acetylmuramoylalanine--D-glutamate ligase
MEDLTRYKDKKIAIAGFGVEGKSAYEYLSKKDAVITVFDERDTLTSAPKDVEVVLGQGVFENLNGFDLVFRSPSIRPEKIVTDGEITSVSNEFFKLCPAPIIAVTGTKGKGTTTSLIAEILKEAGHNSIVVGNIGLSAFDVLDEVKDSDIICYEISSFQLWDIKYPPKVAVILMVEEDHMDVHTSMAEYLTAKSQITSHQSEKDVVVVHPNNQNSQTIVKDSKAKKLEYMSDSGANIRGESIIIDEQEICTIKQVGLVGEHNLENVTAAITAAWQFTHDVDAIARGVKNFKGLEHRLEFVAEKNGVKYFNDSYSASPTAAVAATKVFGEKGIMIFGGKDKKLDYKMMVDAAVSNNSKFLLLIGEISGQLSNLLKEAGFERYVVIEGDMDEIVAAARAKSESGDSVVLSPGTSSFDMFESFKQRGNLFKESVLRINE